MSTQQEPDRDRDLFSIHFNDFLESVEAIRDLAKELEEARFQSLEQYARILSYLKVEIFFHLLWHIYSLREPFHSEIGRVYSALGDDEEDVLTDDEPPEDVSDDDEPVGDVFLTYEQYLERVREEEDKDEETKGISMDALPLRDKAVVDKVVEQLVTDLINKGLITAEDGERIRREYAAPRVLRKVEESKKSPR